MITAIQASAVLRTWFTEGGRKPEAWEDDREVLGWMADHAAIKARIDAEARQRVAREVAALLKESPVAAAQGIAEAVQGLTPEAKAALAKALQAAGINGSS